MNPRMLENKLNGFLQSAKEQQKAVKQQVVAEQES